MDFKVFLCIHIFYIYLHQSKAAVEIPAFGHVHDRLHRHRRAADVTDQQMQNMKPEDRPNCKPGATKPNTMVDTTDRLSRLRALFAGEQIAAYLIPSEDAHQSEYTSEYDGRRQYISGFDGSYGKAVVFADRAALWTDGRYFLQAEAQIDCNWILMKQDEVGVPSVEQYVISILKTSGTKVYGASPFLVGSSAWKDSSKKLEEGSVTMKQVENDLIDRTWTTGRPARPSTVINALPIQFAGRSWQDKIQDMHVAMEAENVDFMIITGLDETAWLFNLRATDIPYNPFFISYATIQRTTNKTVLYLIDHTRKLTETASDPMTKVTLAQHLNTGNTGSCVGKSGLCVEVKAYSNAPLLSDIASVVTAGETNKVWVSFLCNYAIYSRIPVTKLHQDNTPAALQKSQKNAVERQGMKNSHIRDAVALITFVAKLEKEVKEGKSWTEVSAAMDLKQHRKNQRYNRGLSFPSISSSGPNGAVIHYFPTNKTDRAITTNDMYLLDSGGQYLDGTTDVTRTFHFGTPTDYMKKCYTRVLMGHLDLTLTKWPRGLYGLSVTDKELISEMCTSGTTKLKLECYTRVLMGHIDLARFIFVKGQLGREIDAIARRPLWEAGLQYRHGTGHGIGAYLSVHEGPGRISLSHASFVQDSPLDEYQFFSDEPGYYEDGQFGIRHENIVFIKRAENLKYAFPDTTFLEFETITLVPYEPHLIVYDMLSDAQIEWLNKYYKKVWDTISPLIKDDQTAYDWLQRRIGTVTRTGINSGKINAASVIMVVLCAVIKTIL